MERESETARGPHCRMWMGTINNFTDENIRQLEAMMPQVVELVVGKEEAPTTGTPHLHVFVRLDRQQYVSWVLKNLGNGHWEPARNRRCSIEYCKKDGQIVLQKLS